MPLLSICHLQLIVPAALLVLLGPTVPAAPTLPASPSRLDSPDGKSAATRTPPQSEELAALMHWDPTLYERLMNPVEEDEQTAEKALNNLLHGKGGEKTSSTRSLPLKEDMVTLHLVPALYQQLMKLEGDDELAEETVNNAVTSEKGDRSHTLTAAAENVNTLLTVLQRSLNSPTRNIASTDNKNSISPGSDQGEAVESRVSNLAGGWDPASRQKLSSLVDEGKQIVEGIKEDVKRGKGRNHTKSPAEARKKLRKIMHILKSVIKFPMFHNNSKPTGNKGAAKCISGGRKHAAKNTPKRSVPLLEELIASMHKEPAPHTQFHKRMEYGRRIARQVNVANSVDDIVAICRSMNMSQCVRIWWHGELTAICKVVVNNRAACRRAQQ